MQALMTTREAAEALGVSPRCLEGWRVAGKGPRFVKLSGRAVRYRWDDVAAFIAERTRASTSASSPPPEAA